MTQAPSTLDQQAERYAEAFHSLKDADGFQSDPSWVLSLRESAFAKFEGLGFPTARRGNEEWKYTDVRPIARHPFQPVVLVEGKPLDPASLKPFLFDAKNNIARLVFVDGRYVQELSSLSDLPEGVVVSDLAEAMATNNGLVRQHLGETADYESQGFTALNTAFVHSGAFIHVPDRVQVEKPVLVLFLASGQVDDVASHPRVLVVTGEDSKLALVERYASLSEGRHFSNAVTEIVTGQGSVVDYYKIQEYNEQTFHVATTQVEVRPNARFTSVNVDIGGDIARNNLTVIMAGERAAATLNGAYIMTRSQHVDNQVIVDHTVGHNDSKEVYKGILDGKSRSVFHGSVIVREHAAKVNANQVDKNLLLSDEAEADTKPAFWIYCDDVRCGHGAACGKIDEDAIFYLMSRGMNEETARSTLIRAFMSEVVDTIKDDSVREHVNGLVVEKLRNL